MDSRSLGPRLASGRTAEVYGWGEGRVLKLLRSWCPGDWARQEADVARAVAAQGYPVPNAVDVVDVMGRAGIVYERVDGPTMVRVSLRCPWLLVGLARRFAELHVQMHARRGDGLSPVRPSLERTIRAAEAVPPELRAGALEVLESLPDGDSLCHLDFHPDQVIMGRDGPRVMDWMTARRGCSAADVARTLVILTVGGLPDVGWIMRVAIAAWRGVHRRIYLARYRSLRPEPTLAEIRRWMIPLAAARMREGIPGEERRLLRIISAGLKRERRTRGGGAAR